MTAICSPMTDPIGLALSVDATVILAVIMERACAFLALHRDLRQAQDAVARALTLFHAGSACLARTLLRDSRSPTCRAVYLAAASRIEQRLPLALGEATNAAIDRHLFPLPEAGRSLLLVLTALAPILSFLAALRALEQALLAAITHSARPSPIDVLLASLAAALPTAIVGLTLLLPGALALSLFASLAAHHRRTTRDLVLRLEPALARASERPRTTERPADPTRSFSSA